MSLLQKLLLFFVLGILCEYERGCYEFDPIAAGWTLIDMYGLHDISRLMT